LSFALIVNLNISKDDTQDVQQGQFLTVIYDKSWYIGVAEEVDNSNSDVLLKLMYPNGPFRSYF